MKFFKYQLTGQRWIWIGLSAVVSALLVPLGDLEEGRLMGALGTGLHAPIMAVVSLLILALGVRKRQAFLFSILMAGVTEVIQPFTGRDASWLDFSLGTVGIAFGLFVHRRASAWGLILLLGALPAAWVLGEQALAVHRLPILANFESPMACWVWRFQGCEGQVEPPALSEGDQALRVDIGDAEGSYPGAFYAGRPPPWPKTGSLVMDFFWSRRTPVLLWMRVDDRRTPAYADRGQVAVLMSPGSNQVRVVLEDLLTTPSGRKMDPHALVTWGWFLDGAHSGDWYRMDNVHFEPF